MASLIAIVTNGAASFSGQCWPVMLAGSTATDVAPMELPMPLTWLSGRAGQGPVNAETAFHSSKPGVSGSWVDCAAVPTNRFREWSRLPRPPHRRRSNWHRMGYGSPAQELYSTAATTGEAARGAHSSGRDQVR